MAPVETTGSPAILIPLSEFLNRAVQERFIHEESIRHYRRPLPEETDPAKRETIQKLFAEEAKEIPPDMLLE